MCILHVSLGVELRILSCVLCNLWYMANVNVLSGRESRHWGNRARCGYRFGRHRASIERYHFSRSYLVRNAIVNTCVRLRCARESVRLSWLMHIIHLISSLAGANLVILWIHSLRWHRWRTVCHFHCRVLRALWRAIGKRISWFLQG